MEVKEEVKSFRIIQKCDKCKQGEMVPTGLTYTSYPPTYEHKCNCCGWTTSYNKTYPAIVHELKKK